MKIFVVTLLLFLVKGTEARALPDESDVTLSFDKSTHSSSVEVASPSTQNSNLSIIFERVAENMTMLTREIQKQMQTAEKNLVEQAGMVRDTLTSLFERIQGPTEGISKQNTLSITQQLELLKKNISQLDLNFRPINFNQTLDENAYQDLRQNIEQLQKVLGPLVNFFHETITGGVENLRKSIAPGVHEIRKLAIPILAESADMTSETP
ncbi:uncharacterized protein LOC144670179 [Cetorhinus maximus]